MQHKDFNVYSLRVFLSVCSTKSMSKTARELNITQSGVSRCIGALEESLGVQLFDRNCTPLQLTSNGRFLLNRASGIVDRVDQLYEGLACFQEGRTLDLRIGTSHSFTETVTPFLFPKLLDKVNYLYSESSDTPVMCQRLADGKLDMAIATNPMISEKSVTAIPIYSEPYIICLPKTYEEEVRTKEDLLRLAAGLRCVQFPPGTYDALHTSRVLRQWEIPEPNVFLNSIDAMLVMVGQGSAWALLPAMNIRSSHYMEGVSFKLLSTQQGRRSAFILYKDNSYEALAYFIKRASLEIMREKIIPGFPDPVISESIQLIEEDMFP